MKKRARTARARSARRPSAPRTERGLRARRGTPAAASGLDLPAECTLADAETLKMRLAALLKSVQPVTVDVGEVRRIDTASMQLLAAFARDRRVDSFEVRISGESPVFEEAACLLGLREILRPAPAAAAADA
jgi:anti-anti-sigma regulatory factor